MLVGLALIVYAVIVKEWGVVSIGAVILLAGFLVPRMKGPFSLGAPNLQFKGELVDPNESDSETTTQRRLGERSAPVALPPPPAPLESSQRPEG